MDHLGKLTVGRTEERPKQPNRAVRIDATTIGSTEYEETVMAPHNQPYARDSFVIDTLRKFCDELETDPNQERYPIEHAISMAASLADWAERGHQEIGQEAHKDLCNGLATNFYISLRALGPNWKGRSTEIARQVMVWAEPDFDRTDPDWWGKAADTLMAPKNPSTTDELQAAISAQRSLAAVGRNRQSALLIDVIMATPGLCIGET